MRAKTALEESFPPDATLHEELLAVADDDIVEMTNLFPEDTGLDGIIVISTAMASHGPRIKYFVKAGRHQPSFSVSISREPRILANSLPQHVTNQVALKVIRWVALNHEALLNFWENGTTWSRAEVNAFADRLKKIPSA